jgi:predicted RNase H-like HicB family nuclease
MKQGQGKVTEDSCASHRKDPNSCERNGKDAIEKKGEEKEEERQQQTLHQ